MRIALVLFAAGLLLRVLFWLAAPDRGAAWHVGFQGDAPVWQDLAHKLARDQPDELLRLPLRPPGMQWLVAAVWDGGPDTAWLPRLLFVVLGATLGPLVWLLLRRHLPIAVAATAGGLTAAASNLLLLGSGLHVELPYLVLMLLSLFDQERLRTHQGPWLAARWGALHAVLTLLRAEHVLTFALLLGLGVWRAPRWGRTAAVAAGAFAVALLPWQWHAFRLVDAYNATGAPALPPAGVRTPGGLPWQAEALDAVRALPAFQQGPVFQFVQDTVRVRGGTEVGLRELAIVEEAYGCWPQPLGRPFVCLYGGLNFFLGNSPEAAGGFSQQALDRPPQLLGGASSYPPGLLQVLPRGGQLALSYPPHLDLVVNGYRRGLAELAHDPAGSLARTARKLWYGLEGATGGIGGLALPIGLSGVRRPVDLVTAQGGWPVAYRLAVLALAAGGLWSLRRSPWLWPWVTFAATKLLVVVAFFGYARQGALCVPVVALGVAQALQALGSARWVRLGRARTGLLVMVAVLALELVRCLDTVVLVDDQPMQGPAPGPSLDHAMHRITYR